IFTGVRDSLHLAEYLPRNEQTEVLTRQQERRALLQRACVMARRGLFAEALDDVDAATGKSRMAYPISSEERRICAMMLDIQPAYLTGNSRYLGNLGRMVWL